MKVKSESEVAQSCPTLGDPMDGSLPGSSVHGFSRQEYWSGVPLPSPIVHVHTHRDTKEYYSVMRKKQTLIFATIQMNTEGIMLREMLDNERHIMHGFPYLFNLNH